MTRRLVLPVLAAALAVGLAGCGTSSPPLRWSDDDALWFPNGRAIVFDSNRGATPVQEDEGNGRYALYSLRLAGGPPRRLTRDGCDDHDPLPSPNGTEIGFDRVCGSSSLSALMLVSRSGTRETSLAPDEDAFCLVAGRALDRVCLVAGRALDRVHASARSDRPDFERQPVDRPARRGPAPSRLVRLRGRCLRLVARRQAHRVRLQGGSICVIDLRTGAIRRARRFSTLNGVRSVAWSPDDRSLAFIDGSGGSYNPDYSAWVMNAQGTDAHRLPRFGEGNVDGVQWLPGRPARLVVNTDYAKVYVVGVDGRNKNDLPFDADVVAPSRDGTRLLFVRRIFDSNGFYYRSALSLANLKTDRTQRLTQRGP